MIILGIDPGYDRLGLAIIERQIRVKDRVIFSECFETSNKDVIYARLHQVGQEVERVLEKYNPTEVALETLFITKNQKTAMRVAEARGILIYEATKRNIPVFEYSPMQIKLAITGDGASDKTRINKMIGLLIKMEEKKSLDDEIDAIAVALTHLAYRR